MKIFLTIGEINRGSARFDAQFQLDLHSFDKIIIMIIIITCLNRMIFSVIKTAINMGPDQKHSHFREMKIRREVLTLKCN